jgi:hypothetical protein
VLQEHKLSRGFIANIRSINQKKNKILCAKEQQQQSVFGEVLREQSRKEEVGGGEIDKR